MLTDPASAPSSVPRPVEVQPEQRARVGALVHDLRVAATLSILAVVAVGAFAKFPEAVLPIGSDTGMFATYARMMLHGDQPYVAFYDIHPPLTHYYWVLVEALAGTDWTRTCAGAWGTLVPQLHGCGTARKPAQPRFCAGN
jgi:hypothetical protein